MAGHTPKNTPMATETVKPVISAHDGTFEGSEGTNAPTAIVIRIEMTMPITPPAPVSVIASTRNCPTMSRLRAPSARSEEHTSELQSQSNLVCRLLLEKKKKNKK